MVTQSFMNAPTARSFEEVPIEFAFSEEPPVGDFLDAVADLLIALRDRLADSESRSRKPVDQQSDG